MKRPRSRRLFLLAFIASASMGLVASTERSISVEVMTFNIRTSVGRDGSNVWANRKRLVAETIRRSSPDVLGLQEALTDQIEYLAGEFPEYRWLGIDRGLNGGSGLSEATPIFYRHAELSPIESGNFWLSDTPDRPSRGRRGARIVTWARFHHIETRQEVYVFNTHFSLRRGQGQVEAAELISARISALPPGSAVVVIGDFNSVAGTSDPWRAVTAVGLEDAWMVAESRLGPPVTYGGFSAPSEGAENRIDWILVGGPIVVSSVETVTHNDAGRYPSDHYPVVAHLRIEP